MDRGVMRKAAIPLIFWYRSKVDDEYDTIQCKIQKYIGEME